MLRSRLPNRPTRPYTFSQTSYPRRSIAALSSGSRFNRLTVFMSSTLSSTSHRPSRRTSVSMTTKSPASIPPSRKHQLFVAPNVKSRKPFPLFLSLVITIPLFALIFFRFLLVPSTPSPLTASQQRKLLLEKLERPDLDNSLGTDPTKIRGGKYPHPPLPPYTNNAPRKPLFSITSPRNSLNSVTSHFNSSHLPRIHAVFVCSDLCCIDTLFPAVRALVLQTLPPTHLTLIHACSEQDRDIFHREARRALDDTSNIASSYSLRPKALFHDCPRTELEPCALDYMAHLSNTASQLYPHYTLLLSDRVLLENAAVEKCWLSFVVRPDVNAIRFQSYDFRSLVQAEEVADPLVIHPIWPELNHTSTTPVIPVPIIYVTSTYRTYTADSYSVKTSNSDWLPLVRITADARLIREPLCTIVDTGSLFPPIFSFARLNRNMLPAHLFSELAYYRWSARQDESTMYVGPKATMSNVDLAPIPFWPVRQKGKQHIMLVLPWMQMGGSEKCMLDIAEALIDRGWGITFVLTMPYWAEDPVGQAYLRHEWYNRASHISADMFDLLVLGPHQKVSRLFRYMIESRHPEYILMSNSRWAYSHVPFIKALLPEAVLADYNHMIHMSWEGGGMPRFGANNSAFFDLHLTASHDVTDAMKKWIDPRIMKRDPKRVQTCYIGTDASMLHTDEERPIVRAKMRARFGVSESAIVVLFAGRFVVDKGIDVAAEVVKMVAKDNVLSKQLAFVFVGSGDDRNKDLLTSLPTRFGMTGPTFVVVQPPVAGLEELRDYYAMSDVFLLPSVNEGIALVVYEAMADGLLVISTDVGGQREVVLSDTGVLLPNYRTVTGMANHTVEELKLVVSDPDRFANMRRAGKNDVRTNFTTKAFTECVINNLVRVAPDAKVRAHNVTADLEGRVDHIRSKVAKGVQVERFHGRWNREVLHRSIEGYVTVGVKTYVCDDSIKEQVHNLVRSIRTHHPRVRILLGNDGPTILSQEEYIQNDPYTEEVLLPMDSGISFGRNVMVNLTTTQFFLLLDDDHVFDDTTNLGTVVYAMRRDLFDVVGLRVRNLPGIDEYERIGILIPRYVGVIQQFEDMYLTLCIWNENNGPSVYGITRAIPVDVLHNALMASTDVLRKHPWRNVLKVNEHMTFFLDAKEANLSIGYLPSVFVHHRARDYSDCYYKVRFREDKFRNLLPYKDRFLWDVKCGRDFPNRVKQHILTKELDAL